MAKGQDNGTTILLGLKDYKVGERVGGEERVVVKTSAKGKEKRHPDCVHILNFVDVLVGSFSEVIDYTTKKDGCIEVAEKVFPICLRLSENPYNRNSRYYKRYAMSFFPRQSLSKSRIMRYGIKPPADQFYTNRTLRLYQPKCIPGFEELIRQK